MDLVILLCAFVMSILLFINLFYKLKMYLLAI